MLSGPQIPVGKTDLRGTPFYFTGNFTIGDNVDLMVLSTTAIRPSLARWA